MVDPVEPPAARPVDAFVPTAVAWQSVYRAADASVRRLSSVMERPLTEFDRHQAQKKPFFRRSSWQDSLAFGAKTSWRRGHRCAANGEPGKALAYRAASALGFTGYAMGGIFVTLGVACMHEGQIIRRGSVYSKPRTDDGVREDIAGRALEGLRADLARCMAEPIPRDLASAQVRAMFSAVEGAVDGFKAQLAEAAPRLRGSDRIERKLGALESVVDDLRAFAKSC